MGRGGGLKIKTKKVWKKNTDLKFPMNLLGIFLNKFSLNVTTYVSQVPKGA